jgi:hypothetical protein
MLAAIIIACIHFANQKQGFVTFGNVFLHGFKISAVIAIIMLVYTILALTILFPDMKEKIFEMQAAQMEKRGLDDDKMEQATNAMKKFFWPITIGVTIFGTLIWGSIASLIGAAVAKKKTINPLSQQGHLMDISLVIPLKDEEESLPELSEWISRVMNANNYSYEIIFCR